MTDSRKLLFSAIAGIAEFAVITALYYLEGREPNNTLVSAAAIFAAIGLWHYLSRKPKS